MLAVEFISSFVWASQFAFKLVCLESSSRVRLMVSDHS
jgi:hypothetical protein